MSSRSRSPASETLNNNGSGPIRWLHGAAKVAQWVSEVQLSAAGQAAHIGPRPASRLARRLSRSSETLLKATSPAELPSEPLSICIHFPKLLSSQNPSAQGLAIAGI